MYLYGEPHRAEKLEKMSTHLGERVGLLLVPRATKIWLNGEKDRNLTIKEGKTMSHLGHKPTYLITTKKHLAILRYCCVYKK